MGRLLFAVLLRITHPKNMTESLKSSVTGKQREINENMFKPSE